MNTRFAIHALLFALVTLQLGSSSLDAHPQSDQFGAVKAALDYVTPHLPHGRTALNLDYVIGQGVPGTDEIRWVRPYEMLEPTMHRAVLDRLGAVPFSKGTFRWCDEDENVATSGCFTTLVVVTAPEVSGNEAKMTIFWRTHFGDHQRRFEFVLKRSDRLWEIVDVKESDLWV